MAEIRNNTYKIDKSDLDKIKKNFISEMLDENETVEMIKTINDEHQMVVDPHTAVGIGAVKKFCALCKNQFTNISEYLIIISHQPQHVVIVYQLHLLYNKIQRQISR